MSSPTPIDAAAFLNVGPQCVWLERDLEWLAFGRINADDDYVLVLTPPPSPPSPSEPRRFHRVWKRVFGGR